MTEPMDDAELAALRHIHQREGLSTYPPGNTAFDRLFARLDAERTRADAAEAERDAAVSRATSSADAAVNFQRHRDAWRSYALGQRDRRPSDYLPDLPTPTAVQEPPDAG